MGGVARIVKNGYIGVNGVARQFYSGLDETLSIQDSKSAGYWQSFAYYARWLYNEDQEDGNTSYGFVQDLHVGDSSYGGYDAIRYGGTFYSMSNDTLKYSSQRSYPSKYACAFFCPTKEHADAMVKCIQNNYTKIAYSLCDWDTLGLVTPKFKTISSVNNLGKCSDIGYKIYYTATGYYNFSTDNGFKDKYVVEILTSEYLYCDFERPNWSFFQLVVFS